MKVTHYPRDDRDDRPPRIYTACSSHKSALRCKAAISTAEKRKKGADNSNKSQSDLIPKDQKCATREDQDSATWEK